MLSWRLHTEHFSNVLRTQSKFRRDWTQRTIKRRMTNDIVHENSRPLVKNIVHNFTTSVQMPMAGTYVVSIVAFYFFFRNYSRHFVDYYDHVSRFNGYDWFHAYRISPSSEVINIEHAVLTVYGARERVFPSIVSERSLHQCRLTRHREFRMCVPVGGVYLIIIELFFPLAQGFVDYCWP